MRTKLHLALLLIAGAQIANAQVSAYAFNPSITNYSATLPGPNIGYAYQDDTVNVFPLPFTFTFNGTPYNSVNISSNGFLSFDPITGTEYNPISDPSTSNVISAFGANLHSGMLITVNLSNGSNTLTNVSFPGGLSVGDSLIDLNGDFTVPYPKITAINGNNIVVTGTALVNSTGYDIQVNNGRIRSLLSGSTPTRVCEIEYQNFSRFGVFNEFATFKIRLFETYNRVTVAYGFAAPGNSVSTVEIGLKGNSVSDFNSRLVTSNDTYIGSQTASVVTDACEVSPSKMPSGGVSFNWQPYCPVPGLTTSHSTPTVCAGETVTLSASAAQTYSWVGIDTTSQIVVTPSANTIYTLVARWGFCRDTVMFPQTVNPSPTVTVTKSTAYVCAGQVMTLTANGANSYSWTSMGSSAEVTVSPGSTTDYTVTGTSAGCSDTEIITASVAPLPNITIQQSHTMACRGWTVSLFANGANSYQWSNNQNVQGINVSPLNTATYAVTGTSTAGCVSQATVTQYVQDCTGLGETDLAAVIAMYPNPFNGSLMIRNDAGKAVTVTVTDITGRIVQSSLIANDHRFVTDNWAPGAYFFSVSDGQRTVVRKLIKN